MLLLQRLWAYQWGQVRWLILLTFVVQFSILIPVFGFAIFSLYHSPCICSSEFQVGAVAFMSGVYNLAKSIVQARQWYSEPNALNAALDDAPRKLIACIA